MSISLLYDYNSSGRNSPDPFPMKYWKKNLVLQDRPCDSEIQAHNYIMYVSPKPPNTSSQPLPVPNDMQKQ